MELSDCSNLIVPTSGNAKIVPLDGDVYDNVFISSVDELIMQNACNGEKISNGNISERYGHEENTTNHVDSSEDSFDENHEEEKEEVNLSSGGTVGDDIDTSTDISKIEIEKSVCTPATEKDAEESTENSVTGEAVAVGSKINGGEVQVLIRPHSLLPKPEAPPGLTINRSHSLPESTPGVKMPMIGKFFREKSNSLSSSITKKFSLNNVTEFNLSGLKVIVKLKNSSEEDEKEKMEFKGRITFFSKSNCRDCSAVRSFFRERNFRYVEINIDVFPMREKELIERTGSSSVPQIFFNEKLFGGLVVLNSLRNSGMLEDKLKELLSKKCPANAPALPVYGFDDPEEDWMDEMVKIVGILRQRLPIQDRLMKMKIVKNCFSGAEMVEVIMKHPQST